MTEFPRRATPPNSLWDLLEDKGAKENFVEILKKALQELDFTKKDLIKKFDLSKPTVERWLRGETAPHEAMMPPIFDFFKFQIKRKAANLLNSPSPKS